MSPQNSHFADINLLGSDFCDLFKFMPLYLGNGKVKYVFMDRWAGAKELDISTMRVDDSPEGPRLEALWSEKVNKQLQTGSLSVPIAC
jgi:hypothetical protein